MSASIHWVLGASPQTRATPSRAHSRLLHIIPVMRAMRSSLSCLSQAVVGLVVDATSSEPAMPIGYMATVYVKLWSGHRRRTGRIVRSCSCTCLHGTESGSCRCCSSCAHACVRCTLPLLVSGRC